MEYLLFFIYLFLLCWLTVNIPFVKKAGISTNGILMLFLIKITAGLAIGWFTKDVTNDYWPLNADSMNEHRLLLSDPAVYFTNIFQSSYEKGYGGFLDALPSYWNDLQITLISKALAWFNFLSKGNYYINSLLFNFLCFLGHVAFYRLFIQVYPGKKNAVIVSCFLLPSMLYFSSGVQKDGIVFTAIGILCYALFQSLQKNRFTAKRVLVVLFTLAVIFFVRSYVVILIVPALLLWIIVVKYKLPVLKIFAVGYCFTGLLFFSLHYLTGNFNPMDAVIKKQEAFFMLKNATTEIPLDTLRPAFTSFVKNAPQAFNHSFMRPWLADLSSTRILPVIIETLLYHILLLLFAFTAERKRIKPYNSFVVAGIFFAASILLFIGYIVPNLGSIVRYRSIYLVFLITPVLAGINWKKLTSLLKLTKNNNI